MPRSSTVVRDRPVRKKRRTEDDEEFNILDIPSDEELMKTYAVRRRHAAQMANLRKRYLPDSATLRPPRRGMKDAVRVTSNISGTRWNRKCSLPARERLRSQPEPDVASGQQQIEEGPVIVDSDSEISATLSDILEPNPYRKKQLIQRKGIREPQRGRKTQGNGYENLDSVVAGLEASKVTTSENTEIHPKRDQLIAKLKVPSLAARPTSEKKRLIVKLKVAYTPESRKKFAWMVEKGLPRSLRKARKEGMATGFGSEGPPECQTAVKTVHWEDMRLRE